tara:strand:- start:5266 stop:5703 length:438 start_codon:yes stop_codon:yes gene_type:complete
MKHKLFILHGPNLNLLGQREPELYGQQSLEQLNTSLLQRSAELELDTTIKQSNAEHQMIDWIQQTDADFLLLNAGAYTHTSIALRDVILAKEIPFIEIHISNIYAREPFRHQSFFSDIAQGVICGLGTQGYHLGMQAAVAYLLKH